MSENNNRQPESQDTLDALEAVIEGGRRKKNFFEANILPLKGDSKRERRRKVIFDLMILIMVICAVILLWWLVIDPMRYKTTIESFTQAAVTEQPQPTQPGDPEPKEPEGVTRLSFDELLAENHECVAWLSAPGASIELPVVQTTDNKYYLYRDFYSKPSRYGNPFVDWRCKMGDDMSTNVIIYGHHMANQTIFSKLTNYKSADTVKKYPIITLQQPNGTTLHYKVFSVIITNGEKRHDNGYVFAANTPDFPTQENFEGYVKQLMQRTFVNTGVDVKYGDHLLTLQTCVYDFRPAFLYVYGRLVRPGESLSVDTSLIKKNLNPRVPQALYDKYNQKNPYKNAENWEALK